MNKVNQRQLKKIQTLTMPMFRSAMKHPSYEELMRTDFDLLQELLDEESKTYDECYERLSELCY